MNCHLYHVNIGIITTNIMKMMRSVLVGNTETEKLTGLPLFRSSISTRSCSAAAADVINRSSGGYSAEKITRI